MIIENAAGGVVETDIVGKIYKPFTGAKKHKYHSKVTTLFNALKNCSLKNGDTLSFHHQLRNGDYVVNMTLEAVRELGVKNIRMAQTAIFNVSLSFRHKDAEHFLKLEQSFILSSLPMRLKIVEIGKTVL